MKFLEKKVLFTFIGKKYALSCNVVGNIILIVALSNFPKVIKNCISCYVVFVKENDKSLSELYFYREEIEEELELVDFLQDIFLDNIPGEMPPLRGMGNHCIDLIPRSTPPSKSPYPIS